MKLRNADHRYASFDYCYNYFHPTNRKNNTDMEKSCAVLFSYLASWGMLRGSSFLLKGKNIKHFEETIDFINTRDLAWWGIDVDNYTDNNNAHIKIILYQMKKGIEDCVRPTDEKTPDKKVSEILVTKILLGVFGCVPAFDSRFKKTFKEKFGKVFNSLSKDSLERLSEIYHANKDEINKLSCETLVFQSGDVPKRYTKAKIIDMYGFEKSSPPR